MMLRWLALLLTVCVALSGQTFKKSKMYVEQEHKLRLRKVDIDVQDDALVITGTTDKYLSTVRIPYVEITAMEKTALQGRWARTQADDAIAKGRPDRPKRKSSLQTDKSS